MKWDKVLLKDGHFRDTRYLGYITRVVSYMRCGTGKLWGDRTGAEIFKFFTDAAMTNKLTCRRAKYNCLDAIKLEVPYKTEYGYTYRHELAFVIPKMDLIFSQQFILRERDEAGEYHDRAYVVCCHDNRVILVRNGLELEWLCKFAEHWQYEWSTPRFTVTEIFNLLAAKGKVVHLEDFHDKDRTEGKAGTR